MELREWLIVLGLALVSLIVIDGVRRLQRQRRVPQLDQATGANIGDDKTPEKDPEEAQRQAELSWELPNGGARVLKPADYSGLNGKPKLERQAHPGPSRVLSEFRRTKEHASHDVKASASQASAVEAPRHTEPTLSVPPTGTAEPTDTDHEMESAEEAQKAHVTDHADTPSQKASEEQTSTISIDDTSPTLSGIRADEDDVKAHHVQHSQAKRRQLRRDTAGEREEFDHDEQYEDDHYRLVDFDGIKHSLKERMAEYRKVKQQKKEEKAERAKAQAKEKAERKAREETLRLEAQAAAEAEKARLAAEQANAQEAAAAAKTAEAVAPADEPPVRARALDDQPGDTYADAQYDDGSYDNVVRPHPTLEKALRHDVCGGHARKTLTNAEEVIVISVMSRDKEGFDGGTLLELLMMCGLRYSRGMGVFHRFETESSDSELQFSMVNVVKPGSFPIEEMNEFVTPGVTFLMPLPGAEDSSAAFEAMVETAMVVVRHLGGELKDENHSVMTAQTIEFARQRVHEFERRHRLHQQMQAH